MKMQSLMVDAGLLCNMLALIQTPTVRTDTFTVYGNCGMCKRTIERAAKSIPGVQAANWDTTTSTIEVQYNTGEAKLDEIEKAIAASGYDTDSARATDESYNALHDCCLYIRPKS